MLCTVASRMVQLIDRQFFAFKLERFHLFDSVPIKWQELQLPPRYGPAKHLPGPKTAMKPLDPHRSAFAISGENKLPSHRIHPMAGAKHHRLREAPKARLPENEGYKLEARKFLLAIERDYIFQTPHALSHARHCTCRHIKSSGLQAFSRPTITISQRHPKASVLT